MNRRHLLVAAAVALTACDPSVSATPSPDATSDVSLDVTRVDASSDLAPEAAVADTPSELPRDASPSDALPDVTSDTPSDNARDVPADAALDVAADASIDAALDVATDASNDAALDAPADVATDASLDAALDASLDASLDARADAAFDTTDASTDAPRDVASEAASDVLVIDAPPGAWRSALLPDSWVPLHAGGRADAMGRSLQDFSFAGYHRGDAPPYGLGTVVRTVDARLGDGVTDATAAIQADLDAACADTTPGLRVVRIPAGTYRLRFPTATPATDAALRVACSNLVLRGAGPSTTRLWLDDPTNARTRAMIRVAARSFNAWSGAGTTLLTRDAPSPTRTVAVASTAGLSPGDFVAVRTDLTEAFRVERGMDLTLAGTVVWPASTALGLLYLRRVRSVDAMASTVTLDAPTRYELLRRDNARLYRPTGALEEVGLEEFSIGMTEHATSAAGTLPGPLGDNDTGYDVPGTAAYAVHSSTGIRVDVTHDAWIRHVETFAPTGNTSGAHVLSIALWLTAGTSRVTVDGCNLARPQYRGGGGNGYLYLVEAGDNLVVDSVGTAGRHDFITAHIASSGNVFLRARSVNARFSDDAHRLLSQANLYDNVALDGAWLQAVNRGDDSNGAGFTATQTVFWNTRVVAAHTRTRRPADGFTDGFAVETAQYGWGYVIGTSGPGAAVVTRAITNSNYAMQNQGAPEDFVEGVGRGATLFPTSLYVEQRRRRIARGE